MDKILRGYGKPSVLLPGWKGQIYIDQLTGDEYECKGVRGFIKVDGDDQDNQFNWILKKQENQFYEEELITIDLIPGVYYYSIKIVTNTKGGEKVFTLIQKTKCIILD